MHTPLLIHSAGWRREREKSHRDFLTRRLNESQTYYTHKHSPHIHRITIKRRCEPKCQKSSSTGLCIYNKQQKKNCFSLHFSVVFIFIRCSTGMLYVCILVSFFSWFISLALFLCLNIILLPRFFFVLFFLFFFLFYYIALLRLISTGNLAHCMGFLRHKQLAETRMFYCFIQCCAVHVWLRIWWNSPERRWIGSFIANGRSL